VKVHPGHSAQDGVAILVKKARLRIESHQIVPLIGSVNSGGARGFGTNPAFHGEHRTSALLATARDEVTGARVLLGCAHLFPDKHVDPHATLLAALAQGESGDGGEAPSLVVWGGCCNHVYDVKQKAAAQGVGGFRTAVPWGGKTLHKFPEKQDWVFAKAAGGAERPEVWRSPATCAFVKASRRVLAETEQVCLPQPKILTESLNPKPRTQTPKTDVMN